jgi:hypothetical protein
MAGLSGAIEDVEDRIPSGGAGIVDLRQMYEELPILAEDC